MPQPIYMPQKSYQFSDNIFNMLMQFAMMRRQDDKIKEEREFQEQKRQQENGRTRLHFITLLMFSEKYDGPRRGASANLSTGSSGSVN